MRITCFNNRVLAKLLFSLIFFTTLVSGQQNTLSNTTPATSAQLLSYTGEIPLIGTRWILQTLNGHTLQPGTIVTIQFLNNAHFTGSDECNKNGGEYTLHSNNRLTVKENGNYQIGCAGYEGTQEYQYATKLLSVTNYKIEGTILSLANEQGEVMFQYQLLPKFKPNPENLLGKTWQLMPTTDLEKLELDAFTLRFDVNQSGVITFHGTTSCRTYEGKYQITDERLSDFSINRKPDFFGFFCSEKDLNARFNYIDLLQFVWQYNVSQTQLELYLDRGKKLFFEVVNQK